MTYLSVDRCLLKTARMTSHVTCRKQQQQQRVMHAHTYKGKMVSCSAPTDTYTRSCLHTACYSVGFCFQCW